MSKRPKRVLLTSVEQVISTRQIAADIVSKRPRPSAYASVQTLMGGHLAHNEMTIETFLAESQKVFEWLIEQS